MQNNLNDFITQVSSVKPSARQLEWFNTEFYAFVHFGVNTFTNKEWGDGNEPESIFNPKKLDCNQWCQAAISAGMKGIILTAKHHDGFCLWPSKFTDHCVKNAPVKTDVVAECANACRRNGLKFGIYLSPWDRNSKLYGTAEYNDYFCNQLQELLTGYGEIFCVWFDNACGEGPNGKKQEYDFPRYIELIRKLQPNAVIFNDFGPDVRWCGNEAGMPRTAEWSVVPVDLCKYAEPQTCKGPLYETPLTYLYNNNPQLGDLSQALRSSALAYVPSEINMSIRPGWFHHPNEEPHSLQRLFNAYVNSAGHNACFNLNLPPDKGGLISDYDVRRLQELGELLKKEFGQPDYVFDSPVFTADNCAEFTFSEEIELKYIILEEDIEQGQRIESFQIEAVYDDGYKNPLYCGTTVGHKQICLLKDPFEGQNPLTKNHSDFHKSVKIRITGSRGKPVLKRVCVYKSAGINDSDSSEKMNELRQTAHTNDVPIMKDEGSDFICEYIRENNIKSILEIGTAIGYSAMKFARQADDIFVTSIEIDIDRYQQAVRNIAENHLDDRITLFLADANQLELSDKFDMIFIDGPKAQYIPLFEKFKNNLNPDGVIISDNLSFHGMVEDLSLTHNYSTIKLVKKIRKYIDFLKANEEFNTEFFKVGDGVGVSKRK